MESKENLKKLLSEKDLIEKVILEDGEIINIKDIAYNIVLILPGEKPIITAKINMTDDKDDIDRLIQGNVNVLNILSNIPKNKKELEKTLKNNLDDKLINCRYEKFTENETEKLNKIENNFEKKVFSQKEIKRFVNKKGN